MTATRLDRAAKLEDLIRKYSLRVQFELTDVLVVLLPVDRREAATQERRAPGDAGLERGVAKAGYPCL